MVKYVIKHVPSNKYWYEDEGGGFLVDESAGFFVFNDKELAQELIDASCDASGMICTEDGDFPSTEFAVIEIKITL